MQRNSYLKNSDQYEYKYFQPLTFQGQNLQLFPRPFQHQVSGDIRLCYIVPGNIIMGLSKGEINQHVLITGRSGSGKTNVMRVMQNELMHLGLPFMAFDLAKYNTRYLVKVQNE